MDTHDISPLANMIGKLAAHNLLSSEDIASLYKLPYHCRYLEAGSYILRDNDISDSCNVLVSGLAYRHKVSGAGFRQIVAIHIPGEIVDLQQMYIHNSDSNVQALTRCTISTISHSSIQKLLMERPSIAQSLFASTLLELSLSREWMLNIGRRDARTRIAHFFCEFAFRLEKTGRLTGHSFDLPMIQEQLGDALGLTPVHVNRMIKSLVQDGLIQRKRSGITIPNWQRLVDEADFNSRYIHRNT